MIDRDDHLTEDQLQSYLDQELEPGESAWVPGHLAACPACRARLSRLERLSFHLESLPPLDLARDLSAPVLAQLKADRNLSPGITWALALEALGAGAVIGLLVPVLQAAGWLSGLLSTRQDLEAALQVFLTQLASTWLVWWAGLRLQISQVGQSLLPNPSQLPIPLSPWFLIGASGVLVIALNYVLLGRQAIPGRDQQRH